MSLETIIKTKAEKVGASKTALKKRLLLARSVLKREYWAAFKECTFDFQKKRLMSADGKYVLQWELGDTSVGSVYLAKLKD